MKRIINRRAIVGITCIFLFTGRVVALQDSLKAMSLKECIEIALEKNYSLKIVRNETQITKNNVTLGNAGYLPSVGLSGGYSGYKNKVDEKTDGSTITTRPLNSTVDAGVSLSQSVFEGFSIQATHEKLKELSGQGELKTRMQIENLVSDIAATYYDYINQLNQLQNLLHTVRLSEERLRIVAAHYEIGSMSRLELQQAKVDLNADKSKYIDQQTKIYNLVITLNRLMGLKDVDSKTGVRDTIIEVNRMLEFNDLNEKMIAVNTELLVSKSQIKISEQDLKILRSRNYPYVRLNAGYGYTYNDLSTASYDNRQTLGLNYGLSVGMTLFDGMNRRREQRNAKIEIENKKLQQENLELDLQGDLSTLYNAYQTNLRLLDFEKENLITAEDNYEIAMERYKLGELSGIELREAQLSLFSAKERLQSAQYNTKVCEISLFLISGQITHYMEI